MVSNNVSKARFDWVDFSKGIGIILVVYGHVLKGIYNAKLPIKYDFYDINIDNIYSFHMPLFFFLSGLFFEKGISNKKLFVFVKSKFKSLFYLFIIWTLLQTSIEVLMAKYTNGKSNPTDILYGLFYPRAQFWFLHSLFFINIFNAINYKISSRIWLIISTSFWFIWWYFDFNLGFFDRTLEQLIYFNVGVIFMRMISNHSLIDRTYINYFNLFVLIFIFIFSRYIYYNFTFLNKINSVISGLTGLLTIIYLSILFSSNAKCYKFITFLGVNSLPIYLVHILTGSGVRIVLKNILHIDDITIHIVIGVIFGITIPIIVYKFAENKYWLSWLFVYPKL